MNDQDLELLSAYLDGALPEAERRALEARLGASPELRRALDELRAVAKAVQDLPKELLPPGFLARFQARRARGDAPRPDYVLLPPALRPVAFALSTAIVALVVWDRVVTPPEPYMPSDAASAKLVIPANAPAAQLDLSGKITGAASGISEQQAAADAAKAQGEAADKARIAEEAEEQAARRESMAALAAGSDLKGASKSGALQAAAGGAGSVAAIRGSAPGAPIGGEKAEASGGAGAEPTAPAAMSEEERSAKNEQMFDYLEKEKRRMGIAHVLPKEESSSPRRASVAAMLRQGGFAEPEAAPPAEGLSSAAPKMLKAAKKSKPVAEAPAAAPAAVLSPAPTGAPAGRLAPEAGLVFTDARSLASSWVLLGFPGAAPQVDFDSNRVVLLKPSATKILSATPGPDAVAVVFRSLGADEETDPARDRVALVPAGRLPVLFFDATR